MAKNLKTAECVTPKHPDKMCDQISDAILDVCLSTDPNSRVAIEVMGGHGKVYITGEVKSELGFRGVDVTEAVKRITGKDLEININVVDQSSEIAQGVDTGGAGDQGIMVGYACRDNDDFIPKEYFTARALCKAIYEKYPFDGKTQVTIDEDGVISTIVASFQNTTADELREVIEQELPGFGGTLHLNPAGEWKQGGFDADTGLTGRKLMVDNYGPQIAIGGGCFSGKDATKVDRSGAYMARKIAVDLLKLTENVDEVTVKLAYAIGVAQPVMAVAELKSGAGDLMKSSTIDLLDDTWGPLYDLTPKGIINFLNLKEPQFEKTAQWGHFGNSFKWDM